MILQNEAQPFQWVVLIIAGVIVLFGFTLEVVRWILEVKAAMADDDYRKVKKRK